MQVAAQHPEAVGQRSGIRVKERLLLDRIALDSADVSPRDVKLTALIEADLANTRLAFCNRATVSASEAADAIALDGFVQVAFAHLPIQNFTERGQRHLPVEIF